MAVSLTRRTQHKEILRSKLSPEVDDEGPSNRFGPSSNISGPFLKRRLRGEEAIKAPPFEVASDHRSGWERTERCGGGISSSTWCTRDAYRQLGTAAMKSNKAAVLTVAEKCRNILAANWQCHLSTIKADAKGSKGEIYTSKVKYIVKRGKPYLWVAENEAHNVNNIIDERGSLAVTTPFPGPLASLLRSVKKLPSRIALTGDVVLLKDKKAQVATQKLEELILSEQRAVGELSYTVRGVLSSTNPAFTSRSGNLQGLTNSDENYNIYKFDLRSCTYVSGNGGTHDVDLEELQKSKADSLAPYSAMLIDGINQSESRRRALVLFCFTYLNACVRDACITSLDRKGIDILGKVPSPALDGQQFQWKEFRLTFEEDAPDVEAFCRRLVEMEEDTVKKVSGYSGLD